MNNYRTPMGDNRTERPILPNGKLNVALDATPLIGPRTGVGEFCYGILSALGASSEISTNAFAISLRRRGLIVDELPPGVSSLGLPMPARPLHALWSRFDFPGFELLGGRRIEVVHGTNFVVPPTARATKVVTVHDLTMIRYPQMCQPAVLAFPGLVRRAIAKGAWIHTPTHAVAEEVPITIHSPTRQRHP